MKKLLILCGLVSVFASPVMAEPYLNIEEVHSKSGLIAWMVHDETVPLWSMQFSLEGGAQYDPKGKEGLVNLLSSTLDEGAGTRDAEDVQKTLDSHGIRMSFSASRDNFSGAFMTTLMHQDLAISLLDDALNRPHFKPDAVARMKSALLSNLRFQQMEPSWTASKTLFATLFPDHPYGRLVDGDEKSLSSLTADDLKKVKAEMFCKENLKIAIVGAIEKEQAAAFIDKVFGAWPSCEDKSDIIQVDLANAGKRVDVKWDGVQSVVIAVQPGLARQDKDWWAARILDFSLGGGEFSSRLMDEIRVKRGFTYGISTSLIPLDQSKLWMIQSGIEATHTDEAINLIKKIWSDVAQNSLTDAEIKEAKSYLIGAMPLALTSTNQIASIVLQLQEDSLPKDTLDVREAQINAVTADDVKRVAKQYLKADQLTFVVVGPDLKKTEKKK